MALKSGTQGSLLQGVSQQPERVRLEGQVSDQVNMLSDITLGLSSRPTTEELSTLTGADASQSFQEIRFKGTTYLFGYQGSTLRAWTLQGTPVTVNVIGAGTLAYLGDNLRFHVIEDQIVLLNRDKVVAIKPNTDTQDFYTGIVAARGGQFSRTYSIEIEFGDGQIFEASYEAPDGTSTGDAALTSAEAIAEALYDAFLADTAYTTYAGTSGVTLTRSSDVLLWRHPTETMTLRIQDGEAGLVLRATTDKVDDIEDLPKYAPNGTVVRVVSSEAAEDDIWLRFEADNEALEDGSAGFGNDGVWEEWYNPYEDREFDRTTMPHVITLDDVTGEFSVDQAEWLGRQVGDETTAPFVNIVGKRIRDINGFEGRFVLLTNDYCVMSRTKEPFDLWRETATGTVDTDPIDITSTNKDSLKLDWIVPFDRDLFLFEDPGDSQFLITGGGLTPDNASMVLTTEFTVTSGGTPPVSTGRTIYFPFTKGNFSGIKDFFTSSDNDTNAANTVTQSTDKYIDGPIRHMAVSQNFNLSVFLSEGQRKTMYTYKFLWDGSELLQSAWSTWEFQDDILYAFFDNAVIYIVCIDSDGEVFVHFMDLNRPETEYGFHMSADRKQERTVSGGYIDLPYENAKFLQHTGSPFPGQEAIPSLSIVENYENTRYYFDASEIPEGSTLIAGQAVNWSLQPTRVFGRDYRGNVDTSKRVTIQEYIVHLERSGELSARMQSPYGTDFVYNAGLYLLDGEPLDPDLTDVYTGEWTVPWGERADYSTLTLFGDDIRPVTILELSWNGQILKSKGTR